MIRQSSIHRIFLELEEGKKVPICNTSASIREVLLLYFMLRVNYLKSGDLLFIEEPETELHPEKQIDIARLLAKLVHAGLKLVVSTHSDLILQEIIVVIALSKFKSNEYERFGYDESTYLNPDEVAVYVFHRDVRIEDWSQYIRDVTKTGEIPYMTEVVKE